MLYNIKVVYLHCVFHGIRFKVNEDWESGKIPFFFLCHKRRGNEENFFSSLLYDSYFFFCLDVKEKDNKKKKSRLHFFAYSGTLFR